MAATASKMNESRFTSECADATEAPEMLRLVPSEGS